MRPELTQWWWKQKGRHQRELCLGAAAKPLAIDHTRKVNKERSFKCPERMRESPTPNIETQERGKQVFGRKRRVRCTAVYLNGFVHQAVGHRGDRVIRLNMGSSKN